MRKWKQLFVNSYETQEKHLETLPIGTIMGKWKWLFVNSYETQEKRLETAYWYNNGEVEIAVCE